MPSFVGTALLAAVAALPLAAANNAIDANGNTYYTGGTAEIAITDWGSDWYYTVCSCMGATALAIMLLSNKKPRSDRIFFYLCAAICMTATIAYFCMGSNLGWAPIVVEWMRDWPGVTGRNREIFYVRYIDWAITTPLLLLDLMLTAGLPGPTILYTIFLDEVMVVTGLVGALVKSRYKWGFYTFGCVAMFAVFYELAFVGRRSAKALGSDVHRVYMHCGVLTLFMWMLYPLAWGLCEGGNVITANDEALFYGILDLIAKPVFSILLLWGHWDIAPERLGLQIKTADSIHDAEREKAAALRASGQAPLDAPVNGDSA